MPALTREALWKDIQAGKIAPVYVLFGGETYLRDRAVKSIADACFKEGDLRDFNESEFSLSSEDDLPRALGAAQQLPMLAERRVIRISDVRIAASAARDTLKETHEAALGAYLRDPAPMTTVIFVADDLNGNRKLTKLLKGGAAAVEFAPLDDDALRTWAAGIFRKAGFEIEAPALRRLAELIGNDVRRLENEIDKLMTAALPQRTVTLELIRDLVPDHQDINNFALNNSLNAGDRRGAISALEKALADGAEPLMLLGSLSYNYRKLAMIKNMMARGIDRSSILRVAALPSRNIDAMFSAARRSDERTLRRSIQSIARADVAIKTSIGGSGPEGARLQIEMLVSELASS